MRFTHFSTAIESHINLALALANSTSVFEDSDKEFIKLANKLTKAYNIVRGKKHETVKSSNIFPRTAMSTVDIHNSLEGIQGFITTAIKNGVYDEKTMKKYELTKKYAEALTEALVITTEVKDKISGK